MYLEIDEGFATHRKTLRFCALMQDHNAFAYILRLWTWACRSAPDGDLSGMEACDIEIAIQYRPLDGKCYQALAKAGFIDEQNDAPVAIHGWMEHTGGAIEKMDAAAAKKKAYRAHKDGRCDGDCPFCGPSTECPRDIPQTSSGHSDTDKTRQDQSSQDKIPDTEAGEAGKVGLVLVSPEATSNPSRKGRGDNPPAYTAAFLEIWDYTGKRGTKAAAEAQWRKRGSPTIGEIKPAWDAYMLSDRPSKGYVKDLSSWLFLRGHQQEWLPAMRGPPGKSVPVVPADVAAERQRVG